MKYLKLKDMKYFSNVREAAGNNARVNAPIHSAVELLFISPDIFGNSNIPGTFLASQVQR